MLKSKTYKVGFWRTLLKYYHIAPVIFVSTISLNLLALALPLVMIQVYDRIIPYKSHETLWFLTIGCAIAMVLEAICRHLYNRVVLWTGARFESELSLKLFDRIACSQICDRNIPIGESLNHFNNITKLKASYSQNILQSSVDFPFTILFFYGIFQLHQDVGTYISAIGFSYLLVVFILRFFYQYAHKRYEEASDIRQNLLHDFLTKIHNIKSHSFEHIANLRFRTTQNRASRYRLIQNFINSVPEGLGYLMTQCSLFVIVAVGAPAVIKGEMTMGILTACMIFSGRAIQPLVKFGSFWMHLVEAREARIGLNQLFMSAKPMIENPAPIVPPLYLEVQDLGYNFASKVEGFKNLNLQIKESEFIGIVASNSNGVSAFLQILSGLLMPDEGRVTLGPFNISDMPFDKLSRSIGYISSDSTLLQGTVLDNISNFDPNLEHAALEYSHHLGLTGLVGDLPFGYHTPVGRESGRVLPTSTLQLIQLTRVLCLNPRVLVLDRTDQYLEGDLLARFMSMLTSMKGFLTIVAATDNLNILRLADSVYKIRADEISRQSEEQFLPTDMSGQIRVWAA